MNVLSRYIARQVIRTILIVMLVLAGLSFFMQFIAEMSDIGNSHYHVFSAMLFVLMHMPLSLYQFFPIAGLVGSLVGLGQMAASSELIAMQASGMSVRQVTGAVLAAAVVLLIIVTFLGEILSPWLSTQADIYKSTKMQRASSYYSHGSHWLSKNNTFIYYDRQVSENKLQGLRFYKFDANHHLLESAQAKNATHKQGSEWVLHKVSKTSFSAKQVDVTNLDKMPISMDIEDLKLQVSIDAISQLSLPDLYKKIQYNRNVGLTVSELAFSFWQRVFAPLVGLVMIALGVPFVFGSMRHVSTSSRVMIGVGIGFLFYVLNQILGPIGMVLQIPPYVSALLPIVIFFVVYLRLSLRSAR